MNQSGEQRLRKQKRRMLNLLMLGTIAAILILNRLDGESDSESPSGSTPSNNTSSALTTPLPDAMDATTAN